jgi:hypothetical protein
MIQINILSVGTSLGLTRNKPASSAFKSAKVVESEDEKARSGSDRTLAEEHNDQAATEMITWIAGVGDICNRASKEGANLGGGTAQRGREQVESSQQLDSKPDGTQEPRRVKTKRSALQRHCEFWDADHDGIIYPWDIYIGFQKLGFNIALCLWAAVTMAICSSYSTQANWLPHPLFAINIDNIHRSRHGSTTATYDLDAEIDMCRFDSIFDKYAGGKDYLTSRTLYNVWAGQCCANDWFGWFAGGLECKAPVFTSISILK